MIGVQKGVLIYHMIIDHTLMFRYNESFHNCLDFVVAVLSVTTGEVCTRQILGQLVAPSVTHARAYQKTCALVAEHDGVYAISGEL